MTTSWMNGDTFQGLSRDHQIEYDRKNKPHFAGKPGHRIEVIQPIPDGIHEEGTLDGDMARALRADRDALKAKFRV